MNWNFVNEHVSFHKGKTNIGYGTEDHFVFQDQEEAMTLKEFREILNDYTPEKVEKISGVPAYILYCHCRGSQQRRGSTAPSCFSPSSGDGWGLS